MSFVFDTTVGGSASTNTASVAFADAYFETRPFSTAWTDILDTTEKQSKLIAAANRLEDEEGSLAGVRAVIGQKLSQPRAGAYDNEELAAHFPGVHRGAAIARQWMEAECEMALYLIESTVSPTAVDKLAPFSAVTMPSGLELTMRDTNPRTNDALPVAVRRKLRFLRTNVDNTVERA